MKQIDFVFAALGALTLSGVYLWILVRSGSNPRASKLKSYLVRSRSRFDLPDRWKLQSGIAALIVVALIFLYLGSR